MINKLFRPLAQLIHKKLLLKSKSARNIGTVIQPIKLGMKGRVKYHGSFYFGLVKEGDNFKALQKIDYKYLSVIGIFLQKYFSSTFFLLGILLVSILLTFSFNLYSATYLFLFTLILLLLKHWSFVYRLKHGLYGTSDAEAREMIQFIIDNADDIDFTDDGEPKKILKAEDMEYFEEKVSTLNPVTAREVQA